MKGSMLIHPEELSKIWIDKLTDAGVSTLGIHPWGGKKADASLRGLLDSLKTEEYRGLIDYARSRGLSVEYEIHVMEYLLPREYFEEHPEYFRMTADGVRDPRMNFCISNSEAFEIVKKRAAELALSLYGSSHDFYFWMDDGHGLSCQCSECRKMTASDGQLLVMRGMLDEIRRYIPDARMAYLAYYDSLIPPTCDVDTEGIFLEYAPLEKYNAKGEDADERIRREREMLLPLMKYFDKEPKKVLEYWYDNSLWSGWKKPPKAFLLNEEKMREDIEEYKTLGFDVIATFACFLGDDYRELHGDFDAAPFGNALN